MIKANYHTHTNFCDGANSAEELVQEAIEKGFSVLGFSGHSYLPFDESWTMTPSTEREYRKEIAHLKEKYRGELTVLCGVEQDILSESNTETYDYVIGSVHCLEKNGEHLSVDNSAEETRRAVNKHFGGSFDAYAKAYYEQVSMVCKKTNCDIIGHFDLVSKFNEQLGITESSEYLAYAKSALEELVSYNKAFEINTGAMARGYRTSPYPSKQILKWIFEMGGSIVISSDCHNKGFLDYGYDMALRLAKDTGFKSVRSIVESEWVDVPID